MRVSRVVVPLVAAFAAATMAGPPASAVAPAAPAVVDVAKVGFQSSAFGTYVTALDATVRSGPTSAASIGCTTVTGLTRTNGVASATLPIVGRVGAVSTRITTAGSGTAKSTVSTSQVGGVNLLGGAVVAEAMNVRASTADDGGVVTGAGATTFVGLKILGRTFSTNVAPNTSVSLDVAGKRVGVVTLNSQTKRNVDGVYVTTTRGVTIGLLPGNPFGLPASTVVQIGSASAGISAPRVALSGGSGWGLSASTLSGTLVVGRQPHVGVGCYGTTATGSLATVKRDPLVSTGTTSVTTTSTGSATTATSKVVTSVAGPRILGGLISADAIVSEAHAARTSTGTVATEDRSKFVGLKIVGLPLITSNVAPNTKIEVPGLGSVTLHKVTRSARGIEVVMLEVKLNQVIAGLPTGTVVQLAGANANILG